MDRNTCESQAGGRWAGKRPEAQGVWLEGPLAAGLLPSPAILWTSNFRPADWTLHELFLFLFGFLLGMTALYVGWHVLRHEASAKAVEAFPSFSGVLVMDQETSGTRRLVPELDEFAQNASVGMNIIGGDGTILQVNAAELNLLGYAEPEYRGHKLEDFYAKPELAANFLQRLARGENLKNYSATLRHKDGSLRRVQIDALGVREDGKLVYARCLVRSVADCIGVTHRLVASLREVRHLRMALDKHAIVAITDASGKITFANEKFCQVSKYSRAELIGRDHRIVNSGYHPKAFIRNLWETILRGEVWQGEIRNRAKDGSYYWVDATIVPVLGNDRKPVQFIAIRSDITALKQAQIAVRAMTERLRLATSGSGVGIWEWNVVSNQLIWDEPMYRLYGLKPRAERETYEIWARTIHPDDLIRVRQEIDLALRGERPFDTAFRIRWPDNSIHHIKANAVVERDDQNEPIRMTGTSWDVTEQRVAEERIAASLHEKEVLLKEIHHRVKNNMQIISSLLNLQSTRVTSPEAQASFRESQLRVKSMALLHEKIYQSEDLSRVDFSDYLSSLLDHLFSSYGSAANHVRRCVEVRGVQLSLDTAIPCGLIVNELASNAIKYAFPDRAQGELRVKMSRENDGRYHLWFSDNGIGLPADLENRRAGSLGLQLVSLLTAQLHGTVEHGNDGGAQFHIAFQDRGHK